MARCVPILMYHEITAEPTSTGRLAVSPDAFARQLRFLKAAGYSALTAGQFASLAGTSLPAKPVVLTFDDGFADFYDNALPLLLRYGFTGTLFVTSGWTGGSGEYLSKHRPPGMLTGAQVREIADAGIEIGAHSVTHPPLDQLPARCARNSSALNRRWKTCSAPRRLALLIHSGIRRRRCETAPPLLAMSTPAWSATGSPAPAPTGSRCPGSRSAGSPGR